MGSAAVKRIARRCGRNVYLLTGDGLVPAPEKDFVMVLRKMASYTQCVCQRVVAFSISTSAAGILSARGRNVSEKMCEEAQGLGPAPPRLDTVDSDASSTALLFPGLSQGTHGLRL